MSLYVGFWNGINFGKNDYAGEGNLFSKYFGDMAQRDILRIRGYAGKNFAIFKVAMKIEGIDRDDKVAQEESFILR